ncbi:unnamed protein product [Gadus morhua 'NCC']
MPPTAPYCRYNPRQGQRTGCCTGRTYGFHEPASYPGKPFCSRPLNVGGGLIVLTWGEKPPDQRQATELQTRERTTTSNRSRSDPDGFTCRHMWCRTTAEKPHEGMALRGITIFSRAAVCTGVDLALGGTGMHWEAGRCLDTEKRGGGGSVDPRAHGASAPIPGPRSPEPPESQGRVPPKPPESLGRVPPESQEPRPWSLSALPPPPDITIPPLCCLESADDTLSKNESKSQVTGGVLLATLAKCSQGFRYLVAVEERPWNGGLEICCVCEPTIQNATVLRARQRNSTAVVPRPGLESGGLSALMLLYFTEGTVGAYCLSFVFILTVESEREQGFNIVMHHKCGRGPAPSLHVSWDDDGTRCGLPEPPGLELESLERSEPPSGAWRSVRPASLWKNGPRSQE